jgi:hypothetical protein
MTSFLASILKSEEEQPKLKPKRERHDILLNSIYFRAATTSRFSSRSLVPPERDS